MDKSNEEITIPCKAAPYCKRNFKAVERMEDHAFAAHSMPRGFYPPVVAAGGLAYAGGGGGESTMV